jgi:GTP cyclohydrolase IV
VTRRPVGAAQVSSDMLSRVGLTGMEMVVRIGVGGRPPQPFEARIECFVEPDPARGDPRSSRFEDVIADVVREIVLDDAGIPVDRLAQRAAGRIRERQDARRAEAAIAARFPERRPAQVSGAPTQEVSRLHGRALASERGTRRVLGVSLQGTTTSPYVLVAGARERLAAGGFSEAQIARIVDEVPVATHSQLGVGTLHLGCPEDRALDFDVGVLLDIVQEAMSSEIYELLKRGDEAAVVERAHRRPRYVEDCVRTMIAGVAERFAGAPDDVFVSAAQRNMQTIHGHDVVAERAGLLGDLRRELATGQAGRRTTSLRGWLEAGGR